MKKFLFSIFVLTAILSSCSENDVQLDNGKEYVLLNGTIKIDRIDGTVIEASQTAKQVSQARKDSFDEAPEFYEEITMKFVADKTMPEFASEEDLLRYMKDNPSSANGVCELFIDNQLVYIVDIVAGQKVGGKILIDEPVVNGKYPCNYKGIKQCAIDRIHAQNWYDMMLCIGEGVGCVGHKYISCAVDNC